MKITNVLLGLLLLLCVACDKSEKETPNGLKFKVVKAGSGELCQPNDVLLFNFKLTDSKDSVWNDTFANGMPAAVMIQDTSAMRTEDGMMQMMRMVSPGDSIVVNLTIKQFFKDLVKSPIPAGFDSTLSLTYLIKIDSITTPKGVREIQSAIMKKRSAEQLEKDIATIDAYLSEKNISAEKTESGLRYVITLPGKGENGKAGQVAKVNYAGYLLDGQYFDTSIKEIAQAKGVYNPAREPYAPYDVTIDETSVINGWHQALKLMNKGAKATFYIPSTLAYGQQQRSEVIKPNSILVFDMEVVDLK
jgi:FKBP-type peptidyl-prolyl cis-trans isomerase FkpA